MTRLSIGLIRADYVGVRHDEGIVPREGHARVRGDDRELRRRGHLCQKPRRSASQPTPKDIHSAEQGAKENSRVMERF